MHWISLCFVRLYRYTGIHSMYIYLSLRHFSENHKLHSGTKRKYQAFKSVGFILWVPWLSVQHLVPSIQSIWWYLIGLVKTLSSWWQTIQISRVHPLGTMIVCIAFGTILSVDMDDIYNNDIDKWKLCPIGDKPLKFLRVILWLPWFFK